MTLSQVLQIENPIKMLNELVRFGSPYRLANAADFDSLSEPRKMSVIIRAFHIHIQGGYFGEFIVDTSCGNHIDLLKKYLDGVGAVKAFKFVEEIEREFPKSEIPEDEAARIDELEMVEERMGGKWLLDKTAEYRKTGESVVALLAKYLLSDIKKFESGF